ncbi:hypothetical protein PPACK8108_LOCUS19636 [Phakopsora pachyrhizi]|uniref:Uncharacterized protein n=1 Tax=Phakopsora pachyrhizi TaxID=170000 RepID=A0AAV0BF55_PHAPC|nr:hypothetical protein PPACK8108_LOCUS19636 [Phakopsora pachyrhizi]
MRMEFEKRRSCHRFANGLKEDDEDQRLRWSERLSSDEDNEVDEGIEQMETVLSTEQMEFKVHAKGYGVWPKVAGDEARAHLPGFVLAQSGDWSITIDAHMGQTYYLGLMEGMARTP